MDYLVSPTEPLPVRALGHASPVPERDGADVLFAGPAGLVGVQRKTAADLAASLLDGRLARSLGLMRLLDVRVLLVEERLRFGPSGRLLTAHIPLDREQLRGLLWSAQQRGLWLVHTDDAEDSARAIRNLAQWVAKKRHTSLDVAARHHDATGSRAWGVQLLQSFPLVAPVVAANLWDHFEGVGPVRAGRLVDTLHCPAVEEEVA